MMLGGGGSECVEPIAGLAAGVAYNCDLWIPIFGIEKWGRGDLGGANFQVI